MANARLKENNKNKQITGLTFQRAYFDKTLTTQGEKKYEQEYHMGGVMYSSLN